MFANGECTQSISLLRDVTLRKQMEEDLRRRQNLESLGVLAGGIAHDFNNVLTGITSNLGILGMKLDKDSLEHKVTQTALHAADRAAELSKQLLTFSKGGDPLKEPTALAPLLRETTELSLHGSSSKVEYVLPEDLHAVEIDKGQIAQVVQNLVINADQAMPEAGLVKVAAENVAILAGDYLPLEAGNYVKISVEDRGVGISEEVAARIFDPYYTTKLAGHGLGLSITNSIVQKHQGHIAVRSKQNVGTTFEFYLPASLKRVASIEKSQTKFPSGSGRVLIMDDEKLIHDSVGGALEIMGYEVGHVYDGQAALQAYQAAMDQWNGYDIVIMDLTIPGAMGGRETIGKLRKIDSQARVLVASGYANDPVMANYAACGFSGRVVKPVVVAVLDETIKKILE